MLGQRNAQSKTYSTAWPLLEKLAIQIYLSSRFFAFDSVRHAPYKNSKTKKPFKIKRLKGLSVAIESVAGHVRIYWFTALFRG